MGMDDLAITCSRLCFCEPGANVFIRQGLKSPAPAGGGPDNDLATIFQSAESGEVMSVVLIVLQLVITCTGVALSGVPG